MRCLDFAFYIIVLRKMKESRSEKTEVIKFSWMFITANQWCDQGQWLGVVECKLSVFVDSLFASVLFTVRVCLRCAQPEILPIPPLRSNQGCSLHSWLQRRTLRVYSRLCSWLRFQLALSTMIRGEHCTSEGGIKYRVFPLYAVTDIVFFHCTRQRI